jgi:hypothetical protein
MPNSPGAVSNTVQMPPQTYKQVLNCLKSCQPIGDQILGAQLLKVLFAEPSGEGGQMKMTLQHCFTVVRPELASSMPFSLMHFWTLYMRLWGGGTQRTNGWISCWIELHSCASLRQKLLHSCLQDRPEGLNGFVQHSPGGIVHIGQSSTILTILENTVFL